MTKRTTRRRTAACVQCAVCLQNMVCGVVHVATFIQPASTMRQEANGSKGGCLTSSAVSVCMRATAKLCLPAGGAIRSLCDRRT